MHVHPRHESNPAKKKKSLRAFKRRFRGGERYFRMDEGSRSVVHRRKENVTFFTESFFKTRETSCTPRLLHSPLSVYSKDSQCGGTSPTAGQGGGIFHRRTPSSCLLDLIVVEQTIVEERGTMKEARKLFAPQTTTSARRPTNIDCLTPAQCTLTREKNLHRYGYSYNYLSLYTRTYVAGCRLTQISRYTLVHPVSVYYTTTSCVCRCTSALYGEPGMACTSAAIKVSQLWRLLACTASSTRQATALVRGGRELRPATEFPHQSLHTPHRSLSFLVQTVLLLL